MFMPNEIRNPHTTPTRIHYPYTVLEEFHPNGGMWAIPAAKDRPRFIDETARLMANPAQFEKAMLVALRKWPHSVANALTNPALNHRAWIGHAGCYLATRSPEETTRLGWHQLDDAEQWAANHAADMVIAKWRKQHAGTLSAHQQTSLWGDDA